MKDRHQMQNWEVMAKAIPRGTGNAIAAAMRRLGYKCSYDLVTRWTRPQTSDEGPASGHASPLDKITDLNRVLIEEVGRSSAALIDNQIHSEYHRIAYPNSSVLSITQDVNGAVAQLLQDAGRACEALSREGLTRASHFQLFLLKQRAEEILACANQDLLRADNEAQTSATIREGAFPS